MNDMIEQWRERVLAAAESGTALEIRGSGSKAFYGRTPRGELLDTRGYRGVVNYEPTELVVTVRAGTPLAELEALLAENGQMLAFEPPHFGPEATVGGCVAAGLSGPARLSAGSVRDFVLGVKILDGRGEVLSFGGQVMKNVAGYDVSRAMAGSLGTLGVLLEVSLKVLPRPVAQSSWRFAMSEGEAIDRLNDWGGQPIPISASMWHDGTLYVRLSGAQAAVHSSARRLGGEPVADTEADALWASVREHTHRFFAGAQDDVAHGQGALWRLSLPTSAAPAKLVGQQLIEWGGALRWLRSDAPAATIRERVASLGGHATLFRGANHAGEVFHPLSSPLLAIHRRLKSAFDPAGIFNPGRMYDGI